MAIIVLTVLLYINNSEHFGAIDTLNPEAVQNISSLYNTNDLSATKIRATSELQIGNNTILKEGASIPDGTTGLDFYMLNKNRPIASMQMKDEDGYPTGFFTMPSGDFIGNSFRISDFPSDSYIRHERGFDRLNGLSISTINKGELRIGGPDYIDNKYRQFKLTSPKGKQILQWSNKGIDVTGDINLTGKINHNKSIGPVETISTTTSGVPFINYKNKNGSLLETSSQKWIIDGALNTNLEDCRNYLGKLEGDRLCTSYVHDGNNNKCWVGSTPFFALGTNSTGFNSGNIL